MHLMCIFFLKSHFLQFKTRYFLQNALPSFSDLTTINYKELLDMKKLLSAMLALFMVAACSKSDESFKGKMYKLSAAPANMEITLGFDAKEPRFYGKAVNNYFGSYTLEGQKLSFGPAGATMMAGPAEMMEAESTYLQNLPKINAYSLSNGKLTLTGDNGLKLEFDEVSTPAQ